MNDWESKDNKHNKDMNTGVYKFTKYNSYKEFRHHIPWFLPGWWKNEDGKGMPFTLKALIIVGTVGSVWLALTGQPAKLIPLGILLAIALSFDLLIVGYFISDRILGWFYYALEKLNKKKRALSAQNY